jgi:hypothetical protein
MTIPDVDGELAAWSTKSAASCAESADLVTMLKVSGLV